MKAMNILLAWIVALSPGIAYSQSTPVTSSTYSNQTGADAGTCTLGPAQCIYGTGYDNESSPQLATAGANTGFAYNPSSLQTPDWVGQPPLLSSYGQVNVVGDGNGEYADALATQSLVYYFRVNGPGPVLVDVSAAGSIQGLISGNYVPENGSNVQAQAIASLSIPGFLDQYLSGQATIQGTDVIASGTVSYTNSLADPTVGFVSPQDFGFSGQFNFTRAFVFDPGQIYAVGLYTYALGVDNVFTGTAQVSATVDPLFAIDPSVENPSLYSLEFSPGIGNSPQPQSSVPEPATWASMLAGLMVVAALMRRKQASARPFAQQPLLNWRNRQRVLRLQ